MSKNNDVKVVLVLYHPHSFLTGRPGGSTEEKLKITHRLMRRNMALWDSFKGFRRYVVAHGFGLDLWHGGEIGMDKVTASQKDIKQLKDIFEEANKKNRLMSWLEVIKELKRDGIKDIVLSGGHLGPTPDESEMGEGCLGDFLLKYDSDFRVWLIGECVSWLGKDAKDFFEAEEWLRYIKKEHAKCQDKVDIVPLQTITSKGVRHFYNNLCLFKQEKKAK